MNETLEGIVPFVTGRRVVAVDASTLMSPARPADDIPRAVLVQNKERHEAGPMLEPRYFRAASQSFGPARSITLWQRATSDIQAAEPVDGQSR